MTESTELSHENQQAESHLLAVGWKKTTYDGTSVTVYKSPDKPGYLYTLMAAIAKQRIREGAGMWAE